MSLCFSLFNWGLSWWEFEGDETEVRRLHGPVGALSFLTCSRVSFASATRDVSQGELLSCKETPLLYPPGMTDLLKYCIPIPALPPLPRDLSLAHLYKGRIDSIFTFYTNVFHAVLLLFQSFFFSFHRFFPLFKNFTKFLKCQQLAH